MDHGYRIEGNINGREVLGLGAGRTDPTTGISEMEVRFEKRPDGWDPRTIVLMCCDRATVMASRQTPGTVSMFNASGGFMTIGRHLINTSRWGVMRDADGQIMVDVRASSITDFRHETRYDHSRIEGGISHIHHGLNGIAEIRPFTGVMMQAGPNLITVTTNYEAIFEDGTTLYGTTFYPPLPPQPAGRAPRPPTADDPVRPTGIRRHPPMGPHRIRSHPTHHPRQRPRTPGHRRHRLTKQPPPAPG